MEQTNDDIFHVFSDDNLAKTLLVVAPKNEYSKNQKHRLYILTPENQNTNATEEQRQKAVDLKALAKPGLDYPKLTIEFPPLQLRTTLSKIAGIGSDPNAKPGNPINYTNLSHSFWLVASVDGVPEEVLAVYGGKEKLHQLQLDAIKLMHKGVMELEKKRFFHSEYLDEPTKKKWMEAAKKRNCSFDEIAAEKLEAFTEKHENLKIMTNFDNKDKPGPKETGISLGFKSWYMPKPQPKQEDNFKVIESYKQAAIEEGFPADPDFIGGLSQGYRHRRLPTLGFEFQNGKMMWKKLKQPLDPSASNIRGGDLLLLKAEYSMYDLIGSKGATCTAYEAKILSQSDSKFVDSFEAPEKFTNLKPFVPRNNKRKHDDEQGDGKQIEPKKERSTINLDVAKPQPESYTQG